MCVCVCVFGWLISWLGLELPTKKLIQYMLLVIAFAGFTQTVCAGGAKLQAGKRTNRKTWIRECLTSY